MSDILFTPLPKEVQLVVEAGERLFPPSTESAVDAIWREGKRRAPWLFNGKLLSYTRFDGANLYGEVVDYKYYYASTVDKKLAKNLTLKPFGMTALTRCGDRLLIGRRGREVTLNRGFFESAPTGSVDPKERREGLLDLKEQYLTELFEESGIAPSMVASITPLYKVDNSSEGIVEIIAEIVIEGGDPPQVFSPSGEYQEIFWINRSALKRHLARHEEEYVPLVRSLLQQIVLS